MLFRSIEKADWSLTPGRYVGISADTEVDEENFHEQLSEITNELALLQGQGEQLFKRIQETLGALL